jgi:(p)ppGpp synthase/HD superfamily hydrolase
MPDAEAQMQPLCLLTRAYLFAAERHAKQKSKAAAAQPYINHLVEVADLVAEATKGADANLVAAAVLHDTIEDTATTYDELVSTFGRDVADLVAEATDDTSLPRVERKRLQVVHAPGKTPRAKILKLADKISNLRALSTNPSSRRQREQLLEYVTWARAVAEGLRGVSPRLEKLFDEAATAAEAAIG